MKESQTISRDARETPEENSERERKAKRPAVGPHGAEAMKEEEAVRARRRPGNEPYRLASAWPLSSALLSAVVCALSLLSPFCAVAVSPLFQTTVLFTA